MEIPNKKTKRQLAEKNELSFGVLWNYNNHSAFHVVGVPEEEDKGTV